MRSPTGEPLGRVVGFSDISLRVVRGSTPTSDREWNYRKARRLVDFTFEVTIDVHDLNDAQIPLLDIKRVQKEDAPTINPESLQHGAT
jgi:hypothetical protein